MGVALLRVEVIVTGAGGRLGRLLRAAWAEDPPAGLSPIWVGRGPGFDLQWDILSDPPPALPQGADVLHLAGVTRGDMAALQRNVAMVTPLALACRKAAVRRIILASSVAVYAPGVLPSEETEAVAAANPYGQSKVETEAAMRGAASCPVTALRIGNVAGADALLGPRGPDEIVLDPVAGCKGGPLRSWIGAATLAKVLGQLIPQPLPPVLNLACDPPQYMADLLTASGLRWRFGPPNPGVVPVATVSVRRLARLVCLPMADPARLAAEAVWARKVLSGAQA